MQLNQNLETGASGELHQHMEPTKVSSRTQIKYNYYGEQYFPFGERRSLRSPREHLLRLKKGEQTFFEEAHGTDKNTPYKFNGKELDEETSLNYYGARYYDPRISMFYGVDPMAEKYSFQTPFAYAANNPIKFVDVLGMAPGDPLKNMQIRDNRASNLMGKVRTVYNKTTKKYVANSKNHQGFDFKAASGTKIYAVKGGTISKVTGDVGDSGRTIELSYINENGETRVALYGHLSEADVKKGDVVKEGQYIGKTGISGNADEDSPHLHFELRDSETPGSGMTNRVNPNEALDTKFTSQDTDAT
jgi:RHS repeat-associated protein